MVDLHCHILSDVDDGAKDLSESLEIARNAFEQGIHTIVATPHHVKHICENPNRRLLENIQELNKALKEEGINVNILPGQEIGLYGELIDDLEQGSLLTLNDTPYVLIEFSANDVPYYTEKMFFDLQIQGFIPIIAHPERLQSFIKNPDILYKLIKNGAISQLTAGSITGVFGKRVQNFSFQIIEANLVHLIASDAHNNTTRKCLLKDAYRAIEHKYGEKRSEIYRENAELVIGGNHVYKEIPERLKKKKFLKIF